MTVSGIFENPAILVVDDEATQRLLTRDHLEREGFTVVEASNGEEGLEAIAKHRPGLILLDVMMPGMDGFEFCRQVRADPDTRYLPIVLVTGADNAADVKVGFSAGATDFLAKPVKWELLSYRIKFVLRASGFEKQIRDANQSASIQSSPPDDGWARIKNELHASLREIDRAAGRLAAPEAGEPPAENAEIIKATCNKLIALLEDNDGKNAVGA